jgi:hypothetical protein
MWSNIETDQNKVLPGWWTTFRLDLSGDCGCRVSGAGEAEAGSAPKELLAICRIYLA